MPSFVAPQESLAVKHGIHLGRARRWASVSLRPSRTKSVRLLAPAVEARPMAGRERRGFVEEEELGPAAPRHDLAPDASELADAGDPGLRRPAPAQQGARGRIMDDAAIAHEEPALRDGDDVAERRHPVLQRHRDAYGVGRVNRRNSSLALP